MYLIKYHGIHSNNFSMKILLVLLFNIYLFFYNIKPLSHRKSRPIFHRYRTDFLSLCATPLPIYHQYITDIMTISLFIIWRYL